MVHDKVETLRKRNRINPDHLDLGRLDHLDLGHLDHRVNDLVIPDRSVPRGAYRCRHGWNSMAELPCPR